MVIKKIWIGLLVLFMNSNITIFYQIVKVFLLRFRTFNNSVKKEGGFRFYSTFPLFNKINSIKN